jgi:hypothetical protein
MAVDMLFMWWLRDWEMGLVSGVREWKKRLML